MTLTDDARLVVEAFSGQMADGVHYVYSPESIKAAVRLATAYIEAGRVDGGECPRCGAERMWQVSNSENGVTIDRFECGTKRVCDNAPEPTAICKDRKIAILTARLATVQEELDRLTVMCSLTDKDRHVLLQERVAIRELIEIEPFDEDTPIIEAIRELKRKAGGE